MPNVIDGINKMQTDQLSSQLASLKTVTMSNVFSEMRQKASNKAVKGFNGVRKIFNANLVREPEVVPLDKRIADCKADLALKGREEILSETRSILIEKLASIGVYLSSNPSDDEISVAVIDAGCKNFKKQISDGLTPAQKADAIYQRYNEKLVAQTQEKYEKASETEKRKICEQLQKEVDSMPDERMEKLREALGVNKVTGEVLTNFISTSAGASALLLALNASGFGAFMALTTIMHAVFTTTLGITLPFAVYTTSTTILSFFLGPAGWIFLVGTEIILFNRNKNKLIYELLSQIVWSSVLAYGGRFTPREEVLPSWLPEDQRRIAILDNQEFMKLQEDYGKLQAKYDSQNDAIKKKDELQKRKEKEISSLKYKITQQEERVVKAELEKGNAETNLSYAQSEFEQYKQYAKSENESLRAQYSEAQKKVLLAENEVKMKDREISSFKKSNQELQDMISMYEEEQEQIGIEKKLLQSECEQMKMEAEGFKAKLDKAEEKNTKKLEERWTRAFKRFKFETGTIKYVIKNYQYNEYGDIESKLMELHEAKDPAAIGSNRGKLEASGDYHLGFSTSTGFPSRICYKQLKNDSNGKTIAITKVYKHNDSRRG